MFVKNKEIELNIPLVYVIIRFSELVMDELMTHEGNEKIEHGYYKIMNGQMRLF